MLRNLIQSFKLVKSSFSDVYQLVDSLVSEGQAQLWRKIANWENPGRSLELQPGDQSTNIIRFRQSLGDYIKQFLGLFQSLWIGTTFRRAKCDELVHDYYNQLQIFLLRSS